VPASKRKERNSNQRRKNQENSVIQEGNIWLGEEASKQETGVAELREEGN